MYFLEQLVSEWYGYKGYFVRNNVKFGKRARGGYEGEMDVVAFDTKKNTLIHLEVSTDSFPWPKRRRNLQKKFETASNYYDTIFDVKFTSVKKIAIVSFHTPKSHVDLGNNIQLITIPQWIKTITEEIKNLQPTKTAIPEGYPLLRAIQFAIWYGSVRE